MSAPVLPMKSVPTSNARGNKEYKDYLQSERWQKLRIAVQLRARGQCEICNRNPGTDCAHLTYERVFHEPMTDLLWLCHPCHWKLDGQERYLPM